MARLCKKTFRWWKVCAKRVRWERERLEAIEARKLHLLGRWAMLGWVKRWYAGAQSLIQIREAKQAEARQFYEGLQRKTGSVAGAVKRGRLDSKHLLVKSKVARKGSSLAAVVLKSIQPVDLVQVAGGTLAEKNPKAGALLWQLVIAADDEHRSAGGEDGWLHAKLAQPSARNHAAEGSTAVVHPIGALASLRAPDSRCRLLSLYEDALPLPADEFGRTNAKAAPTVSLCCLEADASLIAQECGEGSPLREELKGTAGIVFLATVRHDNEMEWSAHRQRLRLLLATLPKSAEIPCLVLLASDVYPKFDDGHVHRVLGLSDAFFSGRVGAFLFHVVRETPTDETHADFEKCLGWLAEKAPQQPVVKEYELTGLVDDATAHWQAKAIWEHQPVAKPSLVLQSLNEALEQLGLSLDADDPTAIWWPSPEFETLWNSAEDGSCGPEEIPLADWNAPALWAEMRGAVDDLLSALRFPELPPPSMFKKAGGGGGGAGKPLLALTEGKANAQEEAAIEEEEEGESFTASLLQKLGYTSARRRKHGAGGVAREQQADDELDTALGMPSGAELVALVEAAQTAAAGASRALGIGGSGCEWRLLVERLHSRRLSWLEAAIDEQGLPALTLPQKKAELQIPRAPLLVVLPQPVVLASPAAPAPLARRPSWAQVAAGGNGLKRQRKGSISAAAGASAQAEDVRELLGLARDEGVAELSSVLADAQDESARFEDILAALVKS